MSVETYTENPQTAGVAGLPSMEDLSALQLNHEADEQGRKALLVADGTWTTVPGNVTTRAFKGKDDNRPFGSVRAQIISEDGEKTDEINFSFSPVIKLAERNGKPDGAYKRYLQIKKIVETATGEAPQTLGTLFDYLQQYPVKLRVGSFDTEQGPTNAIYAISAVV